MATRLLRVDGTVAPFVAAGLESLQKAVGGYIEFVYLPDGAVLVVNEDGLSLGLPLNEQALLLARLPLVGDVVHADSVHEVCGGCPDCEQ